MTKLTEGRMKTNVKSQQNQTPRPLPPPAPMTQHELMVRKLKEQQEKDMWLTQPSIWED